MKLHTSQWLLTLSSLSLAHSTNQEPLQSTKQVAIIGAGAAGSSAAYSLRKAADDASIPLNITVFDRAPYVGGRSTTVNVFDNPAYPVELGASIFVQVNEHLVNATRDLGLSVESANYHRPKESPDSIGVWDGESFVFVFQDSSSWWNIGKLIWRYGWAPIRTHNLMKRTVGQFMRLYNAPYLPFPSLSAAAEAVGLTDTTAAPGQTFLDANGISTDFARDIIQASTRVNYGQNLPLIHGLEAMVCMATDGAMAVAGGNWQIFDRMLHAAKADVRLNHPVTAVSRSPDQASWTVTFDTPSSHSESLSFDDVILANPLQYSNIAISPPPTYPPDDIPFVKLHVTLFASPHRLSPEYFHVSGPVPETVLTTLPRNSTIGPDQHGVGPANFWSISILRTVPAPAPSPSTSATDSNADDAQPHYVYKIFTPERVTPTFIRSILGLNSTDTNGESSIDDLPPGDISWSHEKIWRPYPFLYPRVTFAEPALAPGLWYTGGIESFISTMETSALMGRNVAELIALGWKGGEEEVVGGDPVDVDVDVDGGERGEL